MGLLFYYLGIFDFLYVCINVTISFEKIEKNAFSLVFAGATAEHKVPGSIPGSEKTSNMAFPVRKLLEDSEVVM